MMTKSKRMGIGLPTHRTPTSPGEMLREEFLLPLGITQSELADRMGIPAGRVNQILQEKRAVRADTAVRLSKVVGMNAEFWLGLQTDWDLWHAKRQVNLRALRPISCEAS
jgi:addiction module HigA family antidote